MKYKGTIRSAEDITGQKGCKEFMGDSYAYETKMDKMAGLSIILVKYNNPNYDYFGANCFWREDWLNDIQEVKEPTDWSKVKIDTKVLVWKKDGKHKYKRHFAKFANGEIHCWEDGGTSWSGDGNTCPWDNAELVEEGGKEK